MDEGRVDLLNNLPEPLLYKVLLNLPTKDVVRTSVLSKSWRNLWRYVPGLDISSCDFPDHIIFFSFVDAFLGFNSESYLESFKLEYDCNSSEKYPEAEQFSRWISTIVDRKVKHIVVEDQANKGWDYWDIVMPPSLYTCDSLVSLKLTSVYLASLEFVFLPCLKFMDLFVHFDSTLSLEKLISGCPVLESLFINMSHCDVHKALRVCSQSLLRFTYKVDDNELVEEDIVVELNAPRLQYLSLSDDRIGSFILNNTSSLVEANIDIVFNWSFKNKFENDQKTKMIRSFLEGISCVKDMTISSKSLKVIYHYSKCAQLPIFRSLSFLRVRFDNYNFETLPMFLGSCPNLKSLAVASVRFPGKERISNLYGPSCLLSSLEYGDIERPVEGEAREMELLSNFLQNSASLKTLTVRLDASLKTEESAAVVNKLLIAHAKSFSDPHRPTITLLGCL